MKIKTSKVGKKYVLDSLNQNKIHKIITKTIDVVNSKPPITVRITQLIDDIKQIYKGYQIGVMSQKFNIVKLNRRKTPVISEILEAKND